MTQVVPEATALIEEKGKAIGKSTISEMSLMERSVLFAHLANTAYFALKEVQVDAKKFGFTTVEFYEKDGAQAYRLANQHDLVIACRGTEATSFNDVAADLKAYPVDSETVGKVHRGFKKEVDDIWPAILEDLAHTDHKDKKFWFCGHSLGGAMATIMASRCMFNKTVPNPEELYTYGCPRVGFKTYVKSLGIVHHRWVNNNDVIPTVPPSLVGYRHHGTQHYLNAYGKVRNPGCFGRMADKLIGMIMGLTRGKIDAFGDHSVVEYIKHLEAALKE